MGTYVRPDCLANALACRAGGAGVLAGGTDYWPARVGLVGCPSGSATVLDLSGLGELRAITEFRSETRIGGLATWTDIAEAALLPQLRALQMAAVEVGGRQIQNRGTIGGNLCNASPAADGVPALLALDAEVELASVRGSRRLKLEDFLLGPRQTALLPDELLIAVVVPKPAGDVRSHFIKLGARRYQLISIVMVAGVLERKSGRVVKARLAVGSCSAVAQRLPELEAALKGRTCDATLGDGVTPSHLSALAPIDDIRSDAAYRREAALVLARRLLAELGGGP